MSVETFISFPVDEDTIEKLEKFCDNKNISLKQFILNAVAEKLAEYGEHFFANYHSEWN